MAEPCPCDALNVDTDTISDDYPDGLCECETSLTNTTSPGAKPATERVWSFDVTVADHDHLHRGVVAMRLFGSQHAHHRVTVLAAGYWDALDMVAAMCWRHGEVTGLYVRI